MKIVKSLVISSLLIVMGPTPVFASTFTFTAIPDQDESALKSRFNKIAAYLSDRLSITVKYIPVKSYSAAVTAFRNDQVQLAWFGGLSGVRARRLVAGSQAIAQGAEDKSFTNYFIAHSSTEIKASKSFPKSIAGKTFTFGSKGSTSGRLMPEYHIRKHFNKSPSKIFKRVGFSGNHSRTIALVQSGAFQVGAVNSAVWNKELKSGKIDITKISKIWTTPEYPNYNWSIRGDVESKYGAGFINKVKKALLNMKDPNLLKQFPRSSFIPATNGDYSPIVSVGKAIGLLE
jgi:phosphonate transport system substrate-binding protein